MRSYCLAVFVLVSLTQRKLWADENFIRLNRFAQHDASPAPVELLWTRGAPGALGDKPGDKPFLTIYLPPAAKATGAAVVICPGGGYAHLAEGHEGKEPAQFLNSLGVAAFVLHYRIAPRYHHPAPMQDVQRALRLVRSRAREWNLDPDRIGVWGFSAGGHLASTAATHFDQGQPQADDPIGRVSCRPDFAILCYPVITMDPAYTHMGSRNNLLGANPAPQLAESLSNEKQVRPDTPPTFLFHTSDDKAVPSQNSVLFYEALRKAKVAAEMHIYEKGRHGVGLAATDPVLSSWPDRLAAWLRQRGVLGSREITVIHDIHYREGDSKQWRLDLATVKGKSGKPRPGIVVIHGGGWLEGDKSSFASRDRGVPGNIVDFAERGFVAAAINYRLSAEAPFPAALEDCKCAVRWLRAHTADYNLDPNRIGVFGNSAGGHLAMLVGMARADDSGDGPYREQSSRVQAVASDSGPIDLSYQYQHGALKEVIQRFMGGPPEGRRAAAYERASPIHQVHPEIPPLLLMYGVLDEQVPVETADRLTDALARAGLKDVSYYRLAAVNHCPYSLARVAAMRAVVDEFFVRTLMKP